MSNLALSQMATQAAQSATSTASHFADQQINQAQQMMQAAAANVAATAASALQSNIDQTKNAVAEATAKASALAETASNLGQKIIDTIPKIPMNITESLNTKIGKVVAGINPSELAQEINSGKFIKTAFMGRSIDAMGTQDVYGINKSGATNLAPDNDLSVVAHDIIRILVDEKTLKDKLPTITKNAAGGFDLSPSALTERVKGCLGNSSAAVNALGSTLTNMATSGLNGAAGEEPEADVNAADDAADDELDEPDVTLLMSADVPGEPSERDRAARRAKRKRHHGAAAIAEPDFGAMLQRAVDDDPFDSHWLRQAGKNPLAERAAEQPRTSLPADLAVILRKLPRRERGLIV
jgi:hypothetical protein